MALSELEALQLEQLRREMARRQNVNRTPADVNPEMDAARKQVSEATLGNALYKDVYGPVAGAVNTRLLGIPGYAAETINPRLKETMLPRATNPQSQQAADLLALTGGALTAKDLLKGAAAGLRNRKENRIAKEASKTTDFIEGLKKVKEARGEVIKNIYEKTPVGEVRLPREPVVTALEKLPKDFRVEVQKPPILGPEGKPINTYSAKELFQIRQRIADEMGKYKDKAYHPDSPVARRIQKLQTVRDELQGVIKDNIKSSELEKANEAYTSLSKLSSDVKPLLYSPKGGQPVSNPMADLLIQGDPNVINRINQLKKVVPETTPLVKSLRARNIKDALTQKTTNTAGGVAQGSLMYAIIRAIRGGR